MRLAALLLGGALILTACTSDDDSQQPPTTPIPSASATAPSDAGLSAADDAVAAAIRAEDPAALTELDTLNDRIADDWADLTGAELSFHETYDTAFDREVQEQ